MSDDETADDLLSISSVEDDLRPLRRWWSGGYPNTHATNWYTTRYGRRIRYGTPQWDEYSNAWNRPGRTWADAIPILSTLGLSKPTPLLEALDKSYIRPYKTVEPPWDASTWNSSETFDPSTYHAYLGSHRRASSSTATNSDSGGGYTRNYFCPKDPESWLKTVQGRSPEDPPVVGRTVIPRGFFFDNFLYSEYHYKDKLVDGIPTQPLTANGTDQYHWAYYNVFLDQGVSLPTPPVGGGRRIRVCAVELRVSIPPHNQLHYGGMIRFLLFRMSGPAKTSTALGPTVFDPDFVVNQTDTYGSPPMNEDMRYVLTPIMDYTIPIAGSGTLAFNSSLGFSRQFDRLVECNFMVSTKADGVTVTDGMVYLYIGTNIGVVSASTLTIASTVITKLHYHNSLASSQAAEALPGVIKMHSATGGPLYHPKKPSSTSDSTPLRPSNKDPPNTSFASLREPSEQEHIQAWMRTRNEIAEWMRQHQGTPVPPRYYNMQDDIDNYYRANTQRFAGYVYDWDTKGTGRYTHDKAENMEIEAYNHWRVAKRQLTPNINRAYYNPTDPSKGGYYYFEPVGERDPPAPHYAYKYQLDNGRRDTATFEEDLSKEIDTGRYGNYRYDDSQDLRGTGYYEINNTPRVRKRGVSAVRKRRRLR